MIELRELSKEVAKYEEEDPLTDMPEGKLRDVRLTLHHQHLPQMSEAGVVEYDQERKLVQGADIADSIKRQLPLVNESDAR